MVQGSAVVMKRDASAAHESSQHFSYLTATGPECTIPTMSNEMTVKVTLGLEDQDALAQCMSRMKPTDEDGRVRSITMPDAIREAIRRMGAKKGAL